MKLLFNAVLTAFSYIVPKQRNLVLFGAGNGRSFKGNTKYAYLYTVRSEHAFKPVWMTKNEAVVKQLQEADMPFAQIGTLRNMWLVLRAEYLFLEQSAKDVSLAGVLLGRFRIVQTWHGTPLKKISSDTYTNDVSLARRFYQRLIRKELSSYTLICSPAAEVSRTLSSGMNGNGNTVLTGYPRNDVLFDAGAGWTDVHAQLDLGQYKKVYAYIPTFRDASSEMVPFTAEELLEIDAQMRATDSVFLIKKHPRQESLPIPEDVIHVRDVSPLVDDVQELLPHCDVLITDYSSVFFDYMLLKRPVVYYSYDLDEYLAQSREMYYQYEDVAPGPFATNAAELLELLKTTEEWFNAVSYQKQYMEVYNRFNEVTDGNSSERLLNALSK